MFAIIQMNKELNITISNEIRLYKMRLSPYLITFFLKKKSLIYEFTFMVIHYHVENFTYFTTNLKNKKGNKSMLILF